MWWVIYILIVIDIIAQRWRHIPAIFRHVWRCNSNHPDQDIVCSSLWSQLFTQPPFAHTPCMTDGFYMYTGFPRAIDYMSSGAGALFIASIIKLYRLLRCTRPNQLWSLAIDNQYTVGHGLYSGILSVLKSWQDLFIDSRSICARQNNYYWFKIKILIRRGSA